MSLHLKLLDIDHPLTFEESKLRQIEAHALIYLSFVTTYHPAVNNLKQTLMEQWSLIQNQPLLKTIYLKPPIISYKRGKSLKDTLVRSKI